MSKRDGHLVEECIELVEDQGHDSITHRNLNTFLDEERVKAAIFWNGQIERYETMIMNMHKTLTRYAEGLRAAKRHMDYDAYEIRRLRDLYMEKTKELNQKDERIYQVTDVMCLMERHYQLKEARLKREHKTTERNLAMESKMNDELRLEL